MPITQDWTIDELFKTSAAYWRGCTLQAAVRLEIFTALGENSLSLNEIAAKTQTDERGAEYLLDALAAMGLLIKENGHYANSVSALELLSKNSPKYIGYAIFHHHRMLDGWVQLHKAVKQGAPVEMRSYGEEADLETFLMGMFTMGMRIAPGLASQIDIAGRRRLLDLGGGLGAYAIHFCLANPGLSAVIYDHHTTRPFAVKTVEKFGLTNRIEFSGGDFNIDPITGGPYDVAWLSQILHSNSLDECQEIINKTVAAMEQGGLILIHDLVLNNTRTVPELAALFSLNMLIECPNGRSYTQAEITAMLEKAGVENINRHSFCGPNDSAILYGKVS